MKLSHKIAVSAVSLAMTATPMTAMAAGPSHGYAKQSASRCEQINMKQQKLVDRFDFSNKWHIDQFQKLVNRENVKGCVTNQSSFGYLRDFGNFESLTAALKYTGLDKPLSGKGTFTVFAPTDDAFAKLPAGLVNTLLTDPSQKSALTNILLTHVISGASVNAATASTLTEATMLNGEKVTIKSQGGNLYINSSKVVLYDIKTSNGIVHVIDTVITP